MPTMDSGSMVYATIEFLGLRAGTMAVARKSQLAIT